MTDKKRHGNGLDMTESRRGRLLIVDDEVELKNALCETLTEAGITEAGHEVVGATNGPDGLGALAKQDFDILLSDLMMPGMDGIQLLGKALEADPNLVGIIMTGQGTLPTAVEAWLASSPRKSDALLP